VRLRVRDYVLDFGSREVTRDGTVVPLSPKSFKLLEILAQQRPNAVSHDELRDKLWPDTVTGGTTLARLVSEARAAIGDTDGDDQVIRTVHRFGYALSATVTEVVAEPLNLAGCAVRWGTQLVPLAAGENVIGRAPGGIITLPSSKVSRRHARIVVTNGQAILEDLGSRNGTYLDDERLTCAAELKHGHRIGIGGALLVFCVAADDGLTSMQTAASHR
jgi:DNA-binding winged helix-turn-helix (wHTH) protein